MSRVPPTRTASARSARSPVRAPSAKTAQRVRIGDARRSRWSRRSARPRRGRCAASAPARRSPARTRATAARARAGSRSAARALLGREVGVARRHARGRRARARCARPTISTGRKRSATRRRITAELLVIFAAEDRDARAGEREELGHDRGDALEMPGPMRAAERAGGRADAHARLVAGRVHRRRRRREQHGRARASQARASASSVRG